MDLEAAYLHGTLLFAGFCGSLVFIAAQEGPPSSIWAVISPIISGALTANYMPTLVIGYLFGEKSAQGTPGVATAFLIGVGGPGVARWITKWVLQRTKSWASKDGAA